MFLGQDPDDIEYCEKHDINYVSGEQCIKCAPWQHENPKIGQEVEIRGCVFKGIVRSEPNNYGWIEVSIGNQPPSNFRLHELKPA